MDCTRKRGGSSVKKKNLVIASLMVASFCMVGMTGQLIAAAKKFPNKPVQIVVPFKPGGGAVDYDYQPITSTAH